MYPTSYIGQTVRVHGLYSRVSLLYIINILYSIKGIIKLVQVNIYIFSFNFVKIIFWII